MNKTLSDAYSILDVIEAIPPGPSCEDYIEELLLPWKKIELIELLRNKK